MASSEKSFGQRLKEARGILKMTQSAFAEPLGLTWTNVKDIEIGRKKLIPELAYEIELVHGINLRWLLTGEGPMFLSHEEPASESNIEPLDKDAAELLEIWPTMTDNERQAVMHIARQAERIARLEKKLTG